MKILILLLEIIHRILVYFMLFGFILPIKFLYIHIFAWPLVYLHWQLNNDRCILTEWEYKLKGIEYKYIPTSSEDHDWPFMRKALSILNINLTNKQMDKYIKKYLTIAWLISLIILFMHYKKKS